VRRPAIARGTEIRHHAALADAVRPSGLGHQLCVGRISKKGEFLQMYRLSRVAPFVLAALCCFAAGPARAQGTPAAAAPAQVNISYEQPSNPKYAPMYEALKRRQVLERLQRFLTPLRLPKPLTIRLAQCNAESMPYKSGGLVTLCYEMVDRIVSVTNHGTQDAKEQALVTDGTFVQAVLHEVAHAVFDLLEVPVWGREDDAADRISALIMVQFGDEVALATIAGTAKFFEYSNKTWTGGDFAELGSPEAQRFYNYLCIAYGADPITFRFLAPRVGPRSGTSLVATLPPKRAERCSGEYAQVAHAFDLRIMPYVDPDQVIRVRAAQWMMSDEIPGGQQQ
jgi:hypothetical protein